MKSNRTRLIVEFKKFQRLPDLPIGKVADTNRSSANSKEHGATLPTVCREAVFPAHGFAE